MWSNLGVFAPKMINSATFEVLSNIISDRFSVIQASEINVKGGSALNWAAHYVKCNATLNVMLPSTFNL